jgi:hypothetical protein
VQVVEEWKDFLGRRLDAGRALNTECVRLSGREGENAGNADGDDGDSNP